MAFSLLFGLLSRFSALFPVLGVCANRRGAWSRGSLATLSRPISVCKSTVNTVFTPSASAGFPLAVLTPSPAASAFFLSSRGATASAMAAMRHGPCVGFAVPPPMRSRVKDSPASGRLETSGVSLAADLIFAPSAPIPKRRRLSRPPSQRRPQGSSQRCARR